MSDVSDDRNPLIDRDHEIHHEDRWKIDQREEPGDDFTEVRTVE